MLELPVPQTPLSEPERVQWTIADFDHLKEIRDYMVRGPGEFCIERARLITSFLKTKGGLDYTDPFTRQAEVMKYILVHKRSNVFPHEVLAGSSTSKRKGVLFYPEFLGLGIWPELLTIPFKKPSPYLITISEIMELDHEIMPFWMHTSVYELLRKKLGEEDLAWRMSGGMEFFMCSKMVCQSHTIPDYKQILSIGLEGLIVEANRRKENAGGIQKIF